MNPVLTIEQLAENLGRSTSWVRAHLSRFAVFCTCEDDGADCCMPHSRMIYNYYSWCTDDVNAKDFWRASVVG